MRRWRKAKHVTTAFERKADQELDPAYIDGRVEEPSDDPPPLQRQAITSPYSNISYGASAGQPTPQGAPPSNGNSNIAPTSPALNHTYSYTQTQPPYHHNPPQYPYPAPNQQSLYTADVTDHQQQPTPYYQQSYAYHQYYTHNPPYNTSYPQPDHIPPSPNFPSSPTNEPSMSYGDPSSNFSAPSPLDRAMTYPPPARIDDPPTPGYWRRETMPEGNFEAQRCQVHNQHYLDSWGRCSLCIPT